MKSLQLILAVLIVFLALKLSQITTRSETVPLPHPPSPQSSPVLQPFGPSLPRKPEPGAFRPGNLHVIFASRNETLKIFNCRGELIYRCRCINETFNLGFFHFGQCPKGKFRLGRTVAADHPAFGPYFTPLYDLCPTGPMHQFQRHGIGLHGGGSRLTNPFQEYQELLKTHGCLRVSNHDLKILVKLIHKSRSRGRVSYITVQ